MPDTRGDIKAEVRNIIGETEGTSLYENPFALNSLIWRQADRLCEDTDCLYIQLFANMVADQADYCAPPGIYKNKATHVLNDAGNWCLLKQESPEAMNSYFGTSWLNWSSGDPPRYAVYDGTTALTLSPPPSQSRSAAIRFEGFYKPGQAWDGYDATSGAALPFTDSSVCPLPPWAVGALTYRVAAMRAAMSVRDPQIVALAPALRLEAETLAGAVERNAATQYRNGKLGLYVARYRSW